MAGVPVSEVSASSLSRRALAMRWHLLARGLVQGKAISLPHSVSSSNSFRVIIFCPLPVFLHLGFYLLAGGPEEIPLLAPRRVSQMPHKELVFCPRQAEAGQGCLFRLQMPQGCSGSLWARQDDAGPPTQGGAPWGAFRRLRFPAHGVAISSCFLLIERSHNAMVTQLPASGMNNSRFVQGQLRSSGCTSHLLPGSPVEEAVAP